MNNSDAQQITITADVHAVQSQNNIDNSNQEDGNFQM